MAPAPASALLSGIITKIGVIGILRLIYFVVGADALRGTWVQVSAIILALITVFVGSYMGTTENVLKSGWPTPASRSCRMRCSACCS